MSMVVDMSLVVDTSMVFKTVRVDGIYGAVNVPRASHRTLGS